MVLNIEWDFRSPDRGYTLWLGYDLLGDLVLIRRWWGLKTGLGGQKIDLMASEAEAVKRIEAEKRLRRQRGYSLLFSSVSAAGHPWALAEVSAMRGTLHSSHPIESALLGEGFRP